MGSILPKSKLIDTIKSTIGYGNGMGYGREYKEWPNDNPFTSVATEADKVTQTQTAMLEIFHFPFTSTVKSIVNAVTTLMPSSTPKSFVTDKDVWADNVETYRVDDPPHYPGLSQMCRSYVSMPLLFYVA